MKVVKSYEDEYLSRYRYTVFMLDFLRLSIIVMSVLCVAASYSERHVTPTLFAIFLILMLLAHFHFQDVYSGLKRTNRTFDRQMQLMRSLHGTFCYTAFYVRLSTKERATAYRIVFRANRKELASYKLSDFNIEVGENRFVIFYPTDELNSVEYFDAYLFDRDGIVVSHKNLKNTLLEGEHVKAL